jgi:hypothetical protein
MVMLLLQPWFQGVACCCDVGHSGSVKDRLLHLLIGMLDFSDRRQT